MSNKSIVKDAFDRWTAGTGYIADILADDLKWTIAGHSLASRAYASKQAFVSDVLAPFAARFKSRFRPVAIHGIYEDGEWVIVHWDGEGVALDDKPYRNTYAWFMRLQGGKVVEATAFYDSISFNEFWTRVAPAPG